MRIGVSQRVDVVDGYNERRDALDQEWANLFDLCNFDMLPIPNTLQNPEHWVEKYKIEGLLLSGGNDLSHLPNALNPAPERQNTESLLLQWATQNKIPVIGVCRGMQQLNHFLGGGVSPIQDHSSTTHAITVIDDTIIRRSARYVNSFHNWGIMKNELAACLKVLALAADGSIEAVVHRELAWVGIMWHPERSFGVEQQADIEFIKSFFLDRRSTVRCG